MRRLAVVTVVVAAAAAGAPAVIGEQSVGAPQVADQRRTSYRNGCKRLFTRTEFKRYATDVYRRERITMKAKRRLKLMIRCQESASHQRWAARRQETLKRERWVRLHPWEHRWNQISSAWQAWARRTSACESDYPSQHDASGRFHGSFQFVLSTWWSAGGTGDPHTKSWYEQAVIAVELAQREGTHHWPRCG